MRQELFALRGHFIWTCKKNSFSLNFKENECVEQMQFLPEKKYFIKNLKGSVKIETEIEKWNNYGKIVELPNICQ